MELEALTNSRSPLGPVPANERSRAAEWSRLHKLWAPIRITCGTREMR
jgi:hypothetical protein